MMHGFCSIFDASPLVAYLDPGTGSYALQLLMAGVFGGLFALKQSWAGLKLRFESGPFATRGRAASSAPRSPANGRSPAPID